MNRQMIARIRTTRPAGRVVLKVRPESAGLDALPAMHLEDGDKFVVPFVPETIQVAGAVFNQQAFLFHDEARVGQYLLMAGGPTRDADRRRMFVVRADGSVIGRSDVGRLQSLMDRISTSCASASRRRHHHPGEGSASLPLTDQLMIWSQFMSQMSLQRSLDQIRLGSNTERILSSTALSPHRFRTVL